MRRRLIGVYEGINTLLNIKSSRNSPIIRVLTRSIILKELEVEKLANI